ncbi:MAG TPA: hydrolase [Gammaproteobacteria bacterium]|nr:hydrolase [Gammaproteobacteria bacterium]
MNIKKLELLKPDNSVLLMIDYQPQMAFGVANIDRQTLKNNVIGLAKSASLFKVPTILTSVETEGFSGYVFPELLDVFPNQDIIERSSMNSWDSESVRKAIAATKKQKLILAGLWTEVCINMPALCAMQENYEVYIVEDACGGTTETAHRVAMERMIQAGAIPVSWLQLLLEWQRDWATKSSYNGVMDIVRDHCGAYGMGVDYAYTMVHKQARRGKSTGKIAK